MVVGEAPGRSEDAAGRPFVGRAGVLLDRALLAAGVSRDDVMVTNAVKCRPPANRTPTLAERKACFPYLLEEIRRTDPYVILALGNAALASLLGRSGVSSMRGHWYRLDRERETWVMPTWHPAYVMYQGGVQSTAGAQFERDFYAFVQRGASNESNRSS